MGKSRLSPKDTVRKRSQNRCEKCSRELTRNVNGMPEDGAARSIHHRQKKSDGGRDSVVCMVNLCLDCHRAIHRDEKKAMLEGWIVVGRSPGKVPFASWRGWVLPDNEGGLDLLDFETGRLVAVSELDPPSRFRKRQARRPRPMSKRSRQVA